MSSKNKLVYLILFLLTVGCKPSDSAPATSPKSEHEVLENGISASFWPFFEQWQADSVFQKQHIIFPLQGVPATTDEMIEGETFYWQEADWLVHRPFDNMGGTFTQSYTQMGHMVTETISDQSKTFQMQRRFAKMNDKWMLIYYGAMRMVKG